MYNRSASPSFQSQDRQHPMISIGGALPMLVKRQVKEKVERSELPVCIGQLENGTVLFSGKSGVFLGSGPLFRIKRLTNKFGKRIHIRMPLTGVTNAKVIAKSSPQTEFECLHPLTGEVLLFCGVLACQDKESEEGAGSRITAKSVTRKAKSAQPRRTKVHMSRSPGHAGDSPGRDEVPNKSERMAEIATVYRAGLNPDLKIDHLCELLQESRATIYRKIAQELFPPPIKRGRGSFWPMQDVLSYQQGKWKPKS